MGSFDFERLAEMVRGFAMPAVIEQSGGGIATMYVGEFNDDGYALIIAGPGWFEGPGWTNPRASLDEFSWGPDDEGESEHELETGDRPLTVIAELIANRARQILEDRESA